MKNIVLEVNIDVESSLKVLRYKKTEGYKVIKENIINSIIDAKSIMGSSFPIKNNDIFISHSHYDWNEVKKIAKEINRKCGLTCFVDSDVWDYKNEVITEIINCLDSVDEEQENLIRDNVNIMLATSIMNVMNNSKLILLFNTKNYIENEDNNDFTYSPWIYHEQCFARFIDINNQNEKSRIMHSRVNESIKFKYLLDYHFDSITLTNLLLWLQDIKDKNIDIISNESVELLYCKYENVNYIGKAFYEK